LQYRYPEWAGTLFSAQIAGRLELREFEPTWLIRVDIRTTIEQIGFRLPVVGLVSDDTLCDSVSP
jgi:hypothetical protein